MRDRPRRRSNQYNTTASSDCNSSSSCFEKLGLTIKNVIVIIAGFYRLKLSLHLIICFIIARRYAYNRGLSSRPVSVRLSVWHVPVLYCIQTAKDIKLLCRPCSIIILVFWRQAPVPNSKGNTFSGGVKYMGVGKFCGFRQMSTFISETVRDRPMVAMDC